MPYERALEIIQTEEYLVALDPDIIKRKRRSKRSLCLPLSGEIIFGNIGCPRTTGFNPRSVFPLSLLFGGGLGLAFLSRPSNQQSFPIVNARIPVIPPLVPLNVAQPGEPGGGDFPQNGDSEVLDLVPEGLRPVAIFPPYLFPRTYPAICVIWAELDPKPYYGHGYGYGRRPKKHPLLAKGSSMLDRIRNIFSGRRDTGKSSRFIPIPRNKRVHAIEVPAFERRYGFRCKITLADRQKCQVGITCDAMGNRLAIQNRNAQSDSMEENEISDEMTTKRNDEEMMGEDNMIRDDLMRRQGTGEDFTSDAPPECRVVLSPSGCTPIV